jgi:hypothetical protein
MSDTPLQPFEQPAVNPTPVCPHCLEDPATMKALGPILLGSLQTVVIFCGNLKCRKVWTVSVIGQQKPLIDRVTPKIQLQ